MRITSVLLIAWSCFFSWKPCEHSCRQHIHLFSSTGETSSWFIFKQFRIFVWSFISYNTYHICIYDISRYDCVPTKVQSKYVGTYVGTYVQCQYRCNVTQPATELVLFSDSFRTRKQQNTCCRFRTCHHYTIWKELPARDHKLERLMDELPWAPKEQGQGFGDDGRRF